MKKPQKTLHVDVHMTNEMSKKATADSDGDNSASTVDESPIKSCPQSPSMLLPSKFNFGPVMQI